MLLEITTPEKTLFKAEIGLVQMPGEMGSFEVLKNHAPLVANLRKGKIKIIDSLRNTIFIDISGGVVQVANNHILILAEGESG